MRRILLIVLSVGVLAPAVAWAQTPAPNDPDVLAEKVLKNIEDRLQRGDTGWWKARGEPALNILGTYTGLESDVATVMAVGDVGEVFPTWNQIADQLEVFGIGYSVYTALNHAAQGRGDKAILSSLKDFAKYKLSKIGAAGALYAAGVGIIDFSLNYFGETVMQSNTDKFYALYCGFHAMKHPSRTDYLAMIQQGGFDALARELDTYWDARYDAFNNDWDSTALGGFAALTDQDPDYKEHFRAKFIREELMPVLEAWANREVFKARQAVIESARRLAEEARQAKVRIVVTVLEERLGTAPAGYAADLLLSGGKESLAGVPVAGETLQFEVPLVALLKDGRCESGLNIVLKNAQDPKGNPRSFYVNLRSPKQVVRKSGSAGVITYRFRKPLVVSTSYPVQMNVTGSAASKVGTVSFLLVSAPCDRKVSATTKATNTSCSVSIKGGTGQSSIPAGKYLLQAYGYPPQGPVTVSGPCTFAYAAEPASSSDAVDPSVPSTSSLGSTLTALAGKFKSRGAPREELYAEGRKAYEDYWTRAAAQFGAFRRAVDGWRAKYEEDVKPVEEAIRSLNAQDGSKPEVKAALDQQRARREALQKARDAKVKEIEARCSEAEKELGENLKAAEKSLDEAEKGNNAERNRRNEEHGKARRALEEVVSRLYEACRDARNASEVIAYAAKNSAAGWWPSNTIEAEMVKVREALAKVETAVARVQAELQGLGPVVDQWRVAYSAVEEICDYVGEEAAGVAYLQGRIDEQIAEADAVLSSGLVAQGKEFLSKCERTLKHRRARSEKMATARKSMEAAGGLVKEVDAAGWASAMAAVRPRAQALFDGLADAGGADDTAEWKKLSDEIEGRVRQERERIGDLLEGAEKGETAYSGFLKVLRDFMSVVSWSDLPPDLFPRVCQPVFDRFQSRDAAVKPFLDLRADVRKAMVLGDTRATRGTALKAALERVDGLIAGAEKKDAGGRLEAVRDAGRELERLPRAACGAHWARWDGMRADLARSGAVEAWARGKGIPFIVFVTMDGQDYGKAFFWPSAVPPGDAQHPSIILEMKIDGIPEDGARLFQASYDGGLEWMPLSAREGKYMIALSRDAAQWRSTNVLLRATLPGYRRLPEWECMPLVRLPE